MWVGFAVACQSGPPTPDAGADDAGIEDAGLDAGDGGADAGVNDGGTDAGVGCDGATYDPVLGTAVLGANFKVLGSAALAATYHLPLGVNEEVVAGGAPGPVLYGYMADGRVHRLGAWPTLALPTEENVAFDAVDSADRALQVLTTWALPSTNGRMAAAYRTVKAQTFVSGAVARFDTAQPDAGVQWLPAPGVESVLGLGSYFLVGSHGLGKLTGTRGVYSFDHSGAATLTATYPTLPGNDVRPGLMAVTTQGVVVLGYYLDLAGRQVLHLPPSASLADALSGGPPIALGTVPEFLSGDDLQNLAGFGPGVAVLRSTVATGTLPVLGRLEFYPLTPQSGGAAVGTPQPILTANDTCTVVSQLIPSRTELFVGLWDRNGQRIIRLAPR